MPSRPKRPVPRKTPPGSGYLDEIVVTATAGGKSKLRTSISTSSVTPETIERSAPRSTAEIFRNIPGIRSESTGGEGNANIAVRGLPVASGGAKFLLLSALLYAPGTVLYAMARREQGLALFGRRERWLFAALCLAAAAGLVALASGTLTI